MTNSLRTRLGVRSSHASADAKRIRLTLTAERAEMLLDKSNSVLFLLEPDTRRYQASLLHDTGGTLLSRYLRGRGQS